MSKPKPLPRKRGKSGLDTAREILTGLGLGTAIILIGFGLLLGVLIAGCADYPAMMLNRHLGL